MVFYLKYDTSGPIDHVGVYIGNNLMINASVIMEKLLSGRWHLPSNESFTETADRPFTNVFTESTEVNKWKIFTGGRDHGHPWNPGRGKSFPDNG